MKIMQEYVRIGTVFYSCECRFKEVRPPDIAVMVRRLVCTFYFEKGILSQTRIYVHLSPRYRNRSEGLVQDTETICLLLLIINRCMKMDTSSISENNIYLTKIIPTKYLRLPLRKLFLCYTC